MSSSKSRTAPVDPRFATTVNQGKHCWSLYNEWLRCASQAGVNDPQCNSIRFFVNSICPTEWMDEWKEARAEGTYFGVQVGVFPEEEEDEEDEDDE